MKKDKKEKISSERDEKIACARKTSIGGQALLDGIMMRGPKVSAMAVRRQSGDIVLEKWDIDTSKKPKILKLPIIRGVFGFIDSMRIGYKALMRSAELALEEIPEESKKTEGDICDSNVEITEEAEKTESFKEPSDKALKKEEKKKSKEGNSDSSILTNIIMVISVIFGVVIAVALFVWLPTFIYSLLPIPEFSNTALNSLIKSAFEGILKIVMLVAYMALVSLMKDIKKTFQYHGAEHKTIFCYESGLELTVENVRKQRRFHPRCGTAFLILMLIVGMFISFFIDPLFIWTTGNLPHIAIRVIVKIALLPLVMGIGYELIKLAGRHDNLFTRVMSAPGLWLQRITVLEPTDDMIECAITAFKEVIPEDRSDNY